MDRNNLDQLQRYNAHFAKGERSGLFNEEARLSAAIDALKNSARETHFTPSDQSLKNLLAKLFVKEVQKEKREVTKQTVEVAQLKPPFICADRVLKWMDEERDPYVGSPQQPPSSPHIREEARFAHNFAWIINWLILPYGIPSMRYSETKKIEERHYTIGLEIQRKGRNYKAVATFCFSAGNDHLYHRSITVKSQGDMVNEMVEQGYYNGDFPPLFGERTRITINPSLKSQTVDDDSYIEKVEGNVVVVKDPKNDATIKVFVSHCS